MSVPPPPNQWGSQPPTGGQPVGAPQSGPPPGGQQGAAPQWGPQQGWGAPPGSPPRRGGKGKWILGGLAVLAVIAVTVVITVLVVGKDSGGGSPTPTNGNSSDFASANDNGPANITTDDPTCAAWNRTVNGLSTPEQNFKWRDRDPNIPVSAWTTEQRTMYESVGKAMRTVADQSVELAKKTPHRVMRELYEQYIAYARTFADRVPTYNAADDAQLAAVVDDSAAVLVNICGAITYGSAVAQAPLVKDPGPPSELAPLGDPAQPQQFLAESDPICADWLSAYLEFDTDTADWRRLSDPNIAVNQWSPEQKSAFETVTPRMSDFADEAEALGRRSNNPTFEDFAVLSSQYRRAYVLAIPTYAPADNYLVTASTNLANMLGHACKAVSG
jgi:hypothetical protein